jgi:hypothetical protein
MGMLNNAQILLDLRVPPNNRLEALRGDRAGQHSIVSMSSGGSAFGGRMVMPTTWRSSTTTEVTGDGTCEAATECASRRGVGRRILKTPWRDPVRACEARPCSHDTYRGDLPPTSRDYR